MTGACALPAPGGIALAAGTDSPPGEGLPGLAVRSWAAPTAPVQQRRAAFRLPFSVALVGGGGRRQAVTGTSSLWRRRRISTSSAARRRRRPCRPPARVSGTSRNRKSRSSRRRRRSRRRGCPRTTPLSPRSPRAEPFGTWRASPSPLTGSSCRSCRSSSDCRWTHPCRTRRRPAKERGRARAAAACTRRGPRPCTAWTAGWLWGVRRVSTDRREIARRRVSGSSPCSQGRQ